MQATTDSTATDAATYYKANGYIVFPGLIPAERIDALLAEYKENILRSDSKFFRQNTSRYEANRLNAHGYVHQSFLDVHAYASHPQFQDAALKIFFSPEILAALTEVTGSAKHNLMQSMLFDLNTETPPHQDWWYLDSVSPAGGLLASWIALEDIAEEAGRFYVLPASQETVLHEEGLPHSKWLDRMRDHVNAHQKQVSAPVLKKGDVLFWNSRTIHGSSKTLDERYSRKSLTAHYLPSELTFGNLFKSKPWVEYKQWEGHHYFANQPEYSMKADIASRVKLAVYDNPALLRLARRFQKRSIAGNN